MTATDRRWWRLRGDEVARAVVPYVEEQLQRNGRRVFLRALERIYGTPETPIVGDTLDETDPYEASSNPIRSGIDTMLAKITTNEPRPMLLTSDGDPSLKDDAKLLTTWLEGQYERLKVHDIVGPKLAFDACLYGHGLAKVSACPYSGIKVERVWVGDMVVDPLEAEHDQVVTYYQVCRIDRDVAKETWPKHRGAIDSAKAWTETDNATDAADRDTDSVTDMVMVVECWRLPVGPSKGRHAICVSNKTLVEEDWTSPRFPFIELRYSPNPSYHWGLGLAARMVPLHNEMALTARDNNESFGRMNPMLCLQRGSNINEERLDNKPWNIITYDLSPPVLLYPQGASEAKMLRERELRDRVMEDEGISPLAARAEKPAGLNSGKAQLVFQDTNDARHIRLLRDYELSLGHSLPLLMFDAAERLRQKDEKRAGDALRVLGGKRVVEAVTYVDANLKPEQYVARVMPASALSQSPAGRMEQVAQLQQLNPNIDPSVLFDLLNFPDLERFNNMQSARRDLADRLIEDASKGEAVNAMTPILPLEYMIPETMAAYALKRKEGASDEVLEALHNLLGQLTVLRQRMQPPQPPMPMQPAGAPPTGAPNAA